MSVTLALPDIVLPLLAKNGLHNEALKSYRAVTGVIEHWGTQMSAPNVVIA